MIGKVRVPQRSMNCKKCGDPFEDIGRKGFVCPNCMTVPSRYYLDIFYKGERVRVFCDKQGSPLDTHERAFDLLAHINYEVNDHSFDPTKYIKSEQKEFYVSTQLERYSEYKVGSLAPSYQTDFKRYIRLAKEFFNAKDVREMRKSDIMKYQKNLEDNFDYSNKTIKNIMEVFKAFLNYLKNDMELITTVPNFPDIEIETKPIKWFSQEDQIKLFDLVPEAFKDIIAFLMLQGCRPSEARAMKCKNVNLQGNMLTISATFSGIVYREKRKGKISRPVSVPIHPEVYPHIARRVKNNLPEAFLFINPHTGRPFGKNSLQRMWARIRTKVGMETSVRLYDATRHSFASNHLNNGTSIYKVSKLMGHSSVKMTEKYGHSDVEGLRVDIHKLTLNRHQTVIKEIANVK
jgi:integrase